MRRLRKKSTQLAVHTMCPLPAMMPTQVRKQHPGKRLRRQQQRSRLAIPPSSRMAVREQSDQIYKQRSGRCPYNDQSEETASIMKTAALFGRPFPGLLL